LSVVSEGKSQDVHRVDAETGEIDWSATVPEVAISNSLVGQMAFVPDAFGPERTASTSTATRRSPRMA
jgi:hypothetical protein